MSKTPNFEKQMQRLQIIVEELEKADLSLEKNLALYKEGSELARSCQELLEKAKNEIYLIDKENKELFQVVERNQWSDEDTDEGYNPETGEVNS